MSGQPADSAGALTAREFARILLIKPSSLGDIVHALPVLHGLRRRYPSARIDWLVADACADLIHGHPDLSGVVRFDRKRFGRLGRNLAVTREFAAFLRDLRAGDYDLVIDLQGLFRSGFISFASGAAVRVGFADAREMAGLFYTHRIPVARQTVHAADKNYAASHVFGFSHVPMTFDLALTDGERRSGAEILSSQSITEGEPFIAVLPGARWETKRWYPDRFVEVIDRLGDSRAGRCVLMGAPDERVLCESIAARCRRRPGNLAGRTGLREMAAVLGRAAVVLCHDSAPMHLAAAQRRPVVALLGPTHPTRTGPYDAAARVLQADLPCVPCYYRRLDQCPYDLECMKRIETSAVVDAVRQTLDIGPFALTSPSL